MVKRMAVVEDEEHVERIPFLTRSRSRRLALISEDAVRELTWIFALAVMNQGCVSPRLIRSGWILRHIDDIEEAVDRGRGECGGEVRVQKRDKGILG